MVQPTQEFDFRFPRLLSLDAARPILQPGDLAQFRGTGYLSTLIQSATGGPHSHTGMIDRRGEMLELLELRELRGGRVTTLAEQVARHPGRIDVFRVDKRFADDFAPMAAVSYMRDLVNYGYGYRGVLRVALRLVPGLWRFFPLETWDAKTFGSAPVPVRPYCSHAAATAYRIGGGLDPVPRQPDHLTTPNDLTHSLMFSYLCTLA